MIVGKRNGVGVGVGRKDLIAEFARNPETVSSLHRKSSDDTWVSNGTYLELRRDLGFSKLDHPVLW